MTEETKAERQQGVQHYISSELSESNGDVLVSYHLTSIYDHSTLEAFSKVVQKLVPELPTLNNLLDSLISSSNVEKSYLVDVKTKLYIATDSSPVDVHTYELCADLVDVVIDVSYIYGVKSLDQHINNYNENIDHSHLNGNGLLEGGQYLLNANVNMTPYDQSSASAIKLNNGMVLYLREVSEFLALICVLRNEYFAKRAILDHNINCFKGSLKQLIKLSESKIPIKRN
jgi:Ras-related GTP-binding protein C/D